MSLLGIFIGLECPVCNGEKSKGMAFCVSCYRELPIPMQRALWKRFGMGFEEAFQKAFWFLRNRPDTRQKKLFSDSA